MADTKSEAAENARHRARLMNIVRALVQDEPRRIAPAIREAIMFDMELLAGLHKLKPTPDKVIEALVTVIEAMGRLEAAAIAAFPA